MNPPWNRLVRPKGPGRSEPRKRSPRFVPCLESLEDRCLPSVIPYITFADGTSGQPVAGQSTDIPCLSGQPTLIGYQADISITVAYSGTAINYVTYTSVGAVTLIPAATLSLNNVVDPLTAGSGSFSFLTLTATDQTQSAVSQVFSFDLKLNSAQTDPTLSATRFSVSVDASNSAAGLNLNFAVTALDPAGNKTSGTAGLITFGQSSATPRVATPSGGIQIGTSGIGDPQWPSSSGNTWSITNPSGTPTFSVTLLNSNTISQQNWSGTQVLHANNPTIDADFGKVITWIDQVNESIISGIPSYFIFSTNPAGQYRLNRNSIIGPNSLVVADTGPGIYLTLSITQEIGQRSSNPSSLATWTGAPPPLEAPLGKQETIRVGRFPQSEAEGLLSGNRITRTNSDSASLAGRVSESESGPLEIMVANILRSLKEAKADDRAKDIAQTAVREPAESDFESDLMAWISNPSFVSKQRDEIDPLGDLNVGLKQLLEGVALNQSIALSSPEEFVGPEQTKDTGEKQAVGSPRSPRTALSWGWRVLAESMATILLALSWPGAMGHGSKSSKGNEERGLRKDECLG